MNSANPRVVVLLCLLPLFLGRLRLVAALAGGAWLIGIDLGVLVRVGLLLVAVLVVLLDTLMTPLTPSNPARATGPVTYGSSAGVHTKEGH